MSKRKPTVATLSTTVTAHGVAMVRLDSRVAWLESHVRALEQQVGERQEAVAAGSRTSPLPTADKADPAAASAARVGSNSEQTPALCECGHDGDVHTLGDVMWCNHNQCDCDAFLPAKPATAPHCTLPHIDLDCREAGCDGIRCHVEEARRALLAEVRGKVSESVKSPEPVSGDAGVYWRGWNDALNWVRYILDEAANG